MVFGGGCSLVTEPTAALTSRFYETIQVSHYTIITLCIKILAQLFYGSLLIDLVQSLSKTLFSLHTRWSGG